MEKNLAFSFRIVDENEMDSPLDIRIKMFLCEIFFAWSGILHDRRVWHKKEPLFTVICESEDHEVIGHAAIVIRSITTTWNYRYNVASVQGISVAPKFRHRGIAKTLVQTALDESKARGYDYAILYCKEPLVKFYQSQGWKLSDDHVVMWNEEDLPITMLSNCPMYYELSDKPFPEGPLDVHSFPSEE